MLQDAYIVGPAGQMFYGPFAEEQCLISGDIGVGHGAHPPAGASISVFTFVRPSAITSGVCFWPATHTSRGLPRASRCVFFRHSAAPNTTWSCLRAPRRPTPRTGICKQSRTRQRSDMDTPSPRTSSFPMRFRRRCRDAVTFLSIRAESSITSTARGLTVSTSSALMATSGSGASPLTVRRCSRTSPGYLSSGQRGLQIPDMAVSEISGGGPCIRPPALPV